MLALEPTARNSNLFPVNAKGDVRLRSPECRGSCGSVLAPRASTPPLLGRLGRPASTCSRMSDSIFPRKIEMIAGGASLAPRRWALAADAMEARSRSAWTSTARMVATRNTRNCMLVWVSSWGSSRLTPVSVDIDQLLCLPEPLTPAKGFSCSRAWRPNRGATRLSVSSNSIWWSLAMWRAPQSGARAGRHGPYLLGAGAPDGPARDPVRGLVLARRYLIVSGLYRHPQPVELLLRLGHERQHPGRNGAAGGVLQPPPPG